MKTHNKTMQEMEAETNERTREAIERARDFSEYLDEELNRYPSLFINENNNPTTAELRKLYKEFRGLK